MPTLWNADTRARLRRRVDALRPDSRPLWGRFTAPQMLAHLTESLRMATGELPVPPAAWVPGLLRVPPFKHLFAFVLPMPKGLPTLPELLARPATIDAAGWAAERRAFDAALERFAGRSPRDAWPEHPAFGRFTGKEWGAQLYRHLDHHCRQFGV